MRNLLCTLALSAGLIAPVWAADPPAPAADKAPSVQQNKMKTCNADAAAKELKGEERKAFMKECLSAKVDAAAAQRDKMKTCNAEAKDKALKGDERKAFMSSCLKGA